MRKNSYQEQLQQQHQQKQQAFAGVCGGSRVRVGVLLSPISTRSEPISSTTFHSADAFPPDRRGSVPHMQHL